MIEQGPHHPLSSATWGNACKAGVQDGSELPIFSERDLEVYRGDEGYNTPRLLHLAHGDNELVVQCSWGGREALIVGYWV